MVGGDRLAEPPDGNTIGSADEPLSVSFLDPSGARRLVQGQRSQKELSHVRNLMNSCLACWPCPAFFECNRVLLSLRNSCFFFLGFEMKFWDSGEASAPATPVNYAS